MSTYPKYLIPPRPGRSGLAFPEFLRDAVPQPPAPNADLDINESIVDMTKRKLADKASAATDSAEARIRAAFLTREDLRNMPDPEPLVDGYLYLDSVARLVGAPGSYKSFLALDWACSVATGRPWHGKAVTAGKVVYLVGEGVRGIDARMQAWELSRNGGDDAHVAVFDGIVDLAALPNPKQDAEWQVLSRVITPLEPRLIVVDTQARYTPGHEENSATDMGVFIHNLDALRRATGACVLLVHHTTRGTDHARGSTAIEGGVQSELVMVKNKRGLAQLKTEKQKDIEEPDPLPLVASAVAGTGSIVLDGIGGGTPDDPFTVLPARVNAESFVYERLARVMFETFHHGTSGATKAEAKAALQGDPELKIVADTRNAGRRFSEAWSTLEEGGRLDRIADRDKYKITDAYAVELGLVDTDETP
ncbi:AAA family ATPase [Rhodococcus sp. IEGM 1401]|uniref:AAA family ATPase n=1 Tax=unclassified Rhodococcus (in: high G+C Gram-positive bacteria) TaxID=192944 RepID=UPI0022B49A1F|nr:MULTISPECIES: AAA family ATPase [unclassified Rhodococcus (in: high G+C Gram-positive bacteria)]MCZ4559888.1 AAA family ATPase [Rhodococcus sp. IEGM 1401]MDI9920068.1 AAA family ATPase [Rhodococcus sp. IEGM 1372]MDV8032469.1 AAA family ATPase [Rhodococcus sp. IEGM 1414]